MRRRPLSLVLLACFAAFPAAGSLAAQSLTAGSVSGSVRDSTGVHLPEASVTLVDRVSGVRRTMLTRFDGAFAFHLLPPAQYDMVIERFGFRPRTVLRIPVRSGSDMLLDVRLSAASAGGPDSAAYPGAPTGGTQLSLRGAHDDFAALSDPLSLAPGSGGLLPGADGELGAAGLPGRLGAIGVDGVTRWSARHPRVSGAALDGIAFPVAALRNVELIPGGVDAEWPGSGGGVLSSFTMPGGRALGGTLWAAGGPDGFTGALELSGAIVPDTAQFSVGVSALTLTRRMPAPWPDSAGAAAAAIASDSFLTDLGAYRGEYDERTSIVSGYGRFDGVLARNHRVSVRAEAATATVDNPALGPVELPSLSAGLRARDLSAAAALVSVITPVLGSELRLSVDAGDRRYDGTGMAGTVFTDGGFRAGSSDLQPGTIKRTAVRASETVHVQLGRVTLKGGLQLNLATHDLTYADAREGAWYFGDTASFAARQGAFRQVVGSVPAAHFTVTTAALFAQVALRPVPGFEVIAALRYDRDQYPADQVRLNSEWLEATGIDNRPAKSSRGMVAPRLAFTWGLGEQRSWQVRGEAGRFAEPLDPGVLAEAITHATGRSVRRGFGALGSWPAVPDSTLAPVRGQALTILGPGFEPPRTSRVGFGITGNLAGVVLRIESDYRHTDFLPLRRDLNLAVNPSARDQFGRPLFGALSKSGTLLAATPGGNRRFAAFDEVAAIDPAGASDYMGLTLGLERSVSRGLALLASYTYSRTTDNWFGARGGAAEARLVPFADSTGRSQWADDVSDFDVPHRLVLGAELRLGALRLALLYRLRSGYPFTPGFRDGVDANADGSGRNDPAFVSDTVSGAADVVGSSACLRSQTGGFAARNSCRDPMASALDLRLAITVARMRGGRTAELLFDAFGLTRSGEDIYDHALYLVDGPGALSTDPATRITTVPLVANPNFGKTLVPRGPAAIVRAGIRVRF